MHHNRYVVECRNPDGSLNFDDPQPPFQESWTEDDLANLARNHNPDALLLGMNVLTWVSDNCDPRWKTRPKTW